MKRTLITSYFQRYGVLQMRVCCHNYLSCFTDVSLPLDASTSETAKRPRCDEHGDSEDCPLANTGSSTVCMPMFLYLLSSWCLSIRDIGHQCQSNRVISRQCLSNRVYFPATIKGEVQLRNLSDYELYCYLKKHSVPKKEDTRSYKRRPTEKENTSISAVMVR